MYRHVLDDPLPWLQDVVRARKPRRLPVVLTKDEVRSILAEMSGTPKLVVSLLYGSGMRLLEGLRLRVKDIDFVTRVIVVRDGKGQQDRRTMLPMVLSDPMREHLEVVRVLHQRDLQEGYGEVWLPHAFSRKYPNAAREWGWQYVFAAVGRSTDPRSGVVRRHHVEDSGIQKAVRI